MNPTTEEMRQAISAWRSIENAAEGCPDIDHCNTTELARVVLDLKRHLIGQNELIERLAKSLKELTGIVQELIP